MKNLLLIFALMCGISCTNPTNSTSIIEQSNSTEIDSVIVDSINVSDVNTVVDTIIIDTFTEDSI